MSYEIPGYKLTRVCGSGSLAAKKHYFVKLDTDGTVVICAAATDQPIGVLQNAPGIGKEAELMVTGITKLVANGVIAIGAIVGTDANGKADSKDWSTDKTEFGVGRALEAAATDGDVIAVLIDCTLPTKLVTSA